MKNNIKEQLKNGMLRERLVFNKLLTYSIVLLSIVVGISTVFICLYQIYALFIVLVFLILTLIVAFLIANSNITKKEVASQSVKFRKIIDEIVEKDEYEFTVIDYGFTVKITPNGFIIDEQTFGFDNFDVFLGTANMYRQASVAFFVVSNFSPYSDDRTYPINFGIVGDSQSFGCAKKYFFNADDKAFEYLLSNPEESAEEILKYGLLKVQIEERKKMKKLQKLAREL